MHQYTLTKLPKVVQTPHITVPAAVAVVKSTKRVIVRFTEDFVPKQWSHVQWTKTDRDYMASLCTMDIQKLRQDPMVQKMEVY